MAWIVVLAVLALMVYSRGFRKMVFVLGAIATIGLLGVYFNHRREQKLRTSRIAFSDLVFEDLRLGPNRYSGGSYHLTGRIRNKSKHALSSIRFRVILRDCTGTPPSCDTVGDTSVRTLATVPSGQVRDISDSAYFSPAPIIRGRMEWSYTVTEISADK